MVLGRLPDAAAQEQRIALEHGQPLQRWQSRETAAHTLFDRLLKVVRFHKAQSKRAFGRRQPQMVDALSLFSGAACLERWVGSR
jgi:hypothetical protein